MFNSFFQNQVVEDLKSLTVNEVCNDQREDSAGEEENQTDADDLREESAVVEEQNEEDDDDSGWITPSNVSRARKAFSGDAGEDSSMDASGPALVACMTSDFAMQNVLVQMGLRAAAPDGSRLIKGARTWIMRCYACFKTTSRMDTRFCPRCGNQTLKRVSCSLKYNGIMEVIMLQLSALIIPFSAIRFTSRPEGG